ncbi:acyltransferase family protein [Vibrio furnissii]|uniref:acyltransferase family protein n=1 Tax=Vibrio furnissii TaxID=29494 RepID=UPI0012AE8DFA|nr:acyltransferase family protein [Vibrio furnissii]
MGFRQDINGLRAIAVLSVVIFHFNPSWVPGGFAGVDVFFAISGFLMTGIIYRRLENQSFSLIGFYLDRARRIIPALGVLCLSLLVLGWLYLIPLDYRDLGKHVTSSLGFISNIIYWREAGYFDMASREKWLLHTWSLSVEWQFYMLYPVAILMLTKVAKLNSIRWMIVFGAFVSFSLSIYGAYNWPSTAFYLLPTRAWEMMLGGIAYLFPLNFSFHRKKMIERVGLACIFFSLFAFTEEDMWPGYFALAPVLGTVLVICANRNNSFLTGNRVSQWVGDVSYSIYLWHWPIVVIMNYLDKLDNFIYIMIGISLSLIFGLLSYVFVEKPTRKPMKFSFLGEGGFALKTLIQPQIIMVCVIGLMGSGVYIYKGVESRFDSQFNTLFSGIIPANRSNGYCFFNVNDFSQVSKSGFDCTIGNHNGDRVSGLLFGDSYAGHNEPFWDYISKKHNLKINSITVSWCFPSFDEQYTGPKTHPAFSQCKFNREYVKKYMPKYDFIILAGNWSDVYKNGFMNSVYDVIDTANKTGLTVYIMASPTQFDTNIAKRFKNMAVNGLSFDVDKQSAKRDVVAQKANSLLENYSEKYSNTIFINREALFSPNNAFRKMGYSLPYSLDGGHLSLEGSLNSGEYFETSEIYNHKVSRYLDSLVSTPKT